MFCTKTLNTGGQSLWVPGWRSSENLRTTNVGLCSWYYCVLLYFFEIRCCFPCKPIFSIPLFCVCKHKGSKNIKGVDSKVLGNFANSPCPPPPATWGSVVRSESDPCVEGADACLPQLLFRPVRSWLLENNPNHTQMHNCFRAIFFPKVSHMFFVGQPPSPA